MLQNNKCNNHEISTVDIENEVNYVLIDIIVSSIIIMYNIHV